MGNKVFERYIVWTNYGSEGWNITHNTDDFNEAVAKREESMGQGNQEVIITEYIPLHTIDARNRA